MQYKVIDTSSNIRGLSESEIAPCMLNIINEEARQGWVYVGPVVVQSHHVRGCRGKEIVGKPGCKDGWGMNSAPYTINHNLLVFVKTDDSKKSK